MGSVWSTYRSSSEYDVMELERDYRYIRGVDERNKARKEFPDEELKRSPGIIVVMGHPHTGRESICHMLRGWSGCPVYDIQGPLDTLSGVGTGVDDIDKEEAARLQSVSFDVICRMATYHVLGDTHGDGANCAILTSHVFNYKLQLAQLIDMMMRMTSTTIDDQVSKRDPRPLIIIECRRRNKFLWEQSFEGFTKRKWYEPGSLKDVDKEETTIGEPELLLQQGNCDEYFLTLARSHHPQVTIKKLVVDPFQDISHSISKFGGGGYSSLFAKAITHLLTNYVDDPNDHDDVDDDDDDDDDDYDDDDYDDGDDDDDDDDGSSPRNYKDNDDHLHPRIVNYAEWRRKQLEQGRQGASRVTTNHYCCKPGDCIFRFTNNNRFLIDNTCEICDQKILTSSADGHGAYYCQFCSLSFHQACATTPKLKHMLELIGDFRAILAFFQAESPQRNHACYSCLHQGKKISNSCNSCFFRTVVKSKKLPVIFNHNGGDDHPLFLRARKGFSTHYFCNACGLEGDCFSYGCHICKSQYHLKCLALPLQTESQHGGHLHTIKIQFSCVIDSDDDQVYEWCLVCYKDIDPDTWVYTCQQCDYVAHLYCESAQQYQQQQQQHLPSGVRYDRIWGVETMHPPLSQLNVRRIFQEDPK